MYGLEAISANNGWAMAITGPLIVMSGLIILSIIISQLHKLVDIFDKKAKQTTEPPIKSKVKSKGEISVPRILPTDILETAKIYQVLIDKLEQPFELRDLYQVAEQNNFPHPIMTVSRLRNAGILISEGDGLFIWNR
ncbi:MAG: OadG family transporter subunit [Thermodesulfobacteriota bacterium]